MSKVIVDAASIHRDVVFIKVNVQDRKVSEWAAELGVKSIPTLLFYKDGKLCRGRIVGISRGVINEIEYILRNLKSICKDELNINDNLDEPKMGYKKCEGRPKSLSSSNTSPIFLERKLSDLEVEAFRRAGAGPFILGILTGAVKSAESAKKELEETPCLDPERRKYLEEIIRQGENAKKHLDEILARLRQARRELGLDK